MNYTSLATVPMISRTRHEGGGTVAVQLGGYARISLDKDGLEMGVERQRDDYGRLAGVRPGWNIAAHYIDNDVSAYKKNVIRPEFERLLKDLRSGAIDGVIAYDLDRLARQPRDLERLIDIYEDKPDLVFCTVTNDINLSTPDGRTMARIMVTFANKASADASRRIARKHRELADNGKNGGGFPAFGWKEDRVTVDPYAADLITKAHDALLAGTRMNTIVNEWQELKVQTSRGTDKPISRTAIKAILRNPRLCGYRAVKGEIHYGQDGQPVEGEWEAICTPERLEAVNAVLDEIRQRYKARKPNDANTYRYLLSGFVRCSECNARMTPNHRSNWNPEGKGSRYTYRCPAKNDGGCGKVSRSGEPLEAHVISLIHEAEAREAAIQTERPESWGGETRLAEVEQEINEYIQARKTGRITAPTMISLVEPLEQEREQLKYQRNRFIVEQAQMSDTANLEKDFERLPIERQRGIVAKHVRAIIVRPAGQGARKFNPDLVEIVWN